MPSLDIFNGDAFSLAALTKAITDTPYQPMRIGSLGLFTEDGINTTSVMIEREGSTLSLVPTQQRGSPGRPVGVDKRTMVTLSAVHLPQTGAVLADSVLNVRAFGSETELSAVQTVVSKKLAKMRRDLDTTLEYHRLGAIKGKVLDSDGATLLDMFSTFGFSQAVHSMELDQLTTEVRNEVVAVKRIIEGALGGIMHRGIRVFCSASFFDALISNANIKDAWDRYNNGSQKRDDLRTGFEVMPGFVFEEYRGQVSGVDFIEADAAYAVPEGVADMFIANFAPADYMETVGTNGLKYYAKQEPMAMNKGVALEAQSNPLHINTRPNAVVKLTRT